MANQITVDVTANDGPFSAAMDRAGAAAERMSQRAQRAQASAQRQADQFIASLQRQVDTFGMSEAQLQTYQARLKGVSDEAAPLIERLDRMRQSAEAFNGAKLDTDGIAKVGGTAELSTQQMAALGHSARSFFDSIAAGGSPITALAQQSGHLQYAFGGVGGAFKAALGFLTPMVIGFGALAVGAGALALALYKGSEEDKRFGESLRLTSGFAGVSRDSVDALSTSLGTMTGVTRTAAAALVQELVSSGRFSSESIVSVSRAVLSMSAATGKSTDEVTKDFVRMTDGVARWAADANKQYHYITAAQYEYIRALEAQGRTQDAVAENARLLNQHMEQVKAPLGVLAKSWQDLEKYASRAWEAMKGAGKPDSIGEALVAAQSRLANLQAERPGFSSTSIAGVGLPSYRTQSAIDADIAAAAKEVENQRARQDLQTRADHTRGEEAKRNEREIMEAGVAYQSALTNRTIAEIQKRIAAAELEQEQVLIGIQKGYDASNVTLQGYIDFQYNVRKGALTNQLKLIQAQADAASKMPVGTPAETVEREARVTEIQTRRFAIMKQMAQLEEQRRLSGMGEGDLMPKQVHDLSTETPAEMFRRSELAATNQVSADAVKDKNDRAAEFVRMIRDQNLAVDAEIAKLDAETAALGGVSEARREAIAIAKLQAQADKDIAQNGNERERILSELADRTDRLTAAMRRNYAAARSFETGASAAWNRYKEEAANSAQFADRVVGGSLERLTDALATFASTGKLHLGGLFRFMADEFLKQLIRMQLASAGSGLMGLLGSFGSLFGGGSVDGAGGIGNAEGAYPTSLAVGTNYVPYDGMLAKLHEGEAVVPKAYNPAAGGQSISRSSQGATVHIHGVPADHTARASEDSSGALHVMLERAAAEGASRGHARVLTEISRGGQMHDALAGTYGLRRNLPRRA